MALHRKLTRLTSVSAETIAAAAACLRAGGLVAMPTETVYGLAADATDARAIARLYAAKGRPAFNPLIAHVPAVTAARRLALEGVTFSEVLEALRADLARQYLDDQALSISRIAWLLGYQEVSAFTHAFKRWTGKTPRETRLPSVAARESPAR